MSQLPLRWRLNNAAVSYIVYIWQMFWPVRLAAFYPHPNDQLRLGQVLLAVAFLIAITLLAIHWRKKRPYIFTGWFWYLGMLVPVIGLVQAGEQARSDRYTYLPQIGLYVLITWGITDLMTVFNGAQSSPLTRHLRQAGQSSRRKARSKHLTCPVTVARASNLSVATGVVRRDRGNDHHLIQLACVCANLVLEKQRGALEPRAGCYQ